MTLRLAITISDEQGDPLKGVAVVEMDRSGIVLDIMFIDLRDPEAVRDLLTQLEVDYVLIKESSANFLDFGGRVYLYRSSELRDILREFITGRVRPLDEESDGLPPPWN